MLPCAGFLPLLKPRGTSSRRLLNRVQRLINAKPNRVKLGHTGTLDPFAEGLLVSPVSRATKQLAAMSIESQAGKEYLATVRLGMSTETDDILGQRIGGMDVTRISNGDVSSTLHEFLGVVPQQPPVFSALKLNGVRSHTLARDGRFKDDSASRNVMIDSIDILDIARGKSHFSVPSVQQWETECAALLAATNSRLCPGVVQSYSPESGCMDVVLRVRCGRGVYVRSIARDLGARLGVGGALVRLVRTATDGFTLLGDGVTTDDLNEDTMFELMAPAGVPFLKAERGVSSDASASRGEHQDNDRMLRLLGLTATQEQFGADQGEKYVQQDWLGTFGWDEVRNRYLSGIQAEQYAGYGDWVRQAGARGTAGVGGALGLPVRIPKFRAPKWGTSTILHSAAGHENTPRSPTSTTQDGDSEPSEQRDDGDSSVDTTLQEVNGIDTGKAIRKIFLTSWGKAAISSEQLLRGVSQVSEQVAMAMQSLQQLPGYDCSQAARSHEIRAEDECADRDRAAGTDGSGAMVKDLRAMPVFLRFEDIDGSYQKGSLSDKDGPLADEATLRLLAASATEIHRLVWASDRRMQRQLTKFMLPLVTKGMEPGELQGALAPEEVAGQVAEAVHSASEGAARLAVAGLGPGARAPVECQGRADVKPSHLARETLARFRSMEDELVRAAAEVRQRWAVGFGGGLVAATRMPMVAVAVRGVEPSSPDEAGGVGARGEGVAIAHFTGQEASGGHWVSPQEARGQGRGKGKGKGKKGARVRRAGHQQGVVLGEEEDPLVCALWRWLHAPLEEALADFAGSSGHLARVEYGESRRRARLMLRAMAQSGKETGAQQTVTTARN